MRLLPQPAERMKTDACAASLFSVPKLKRHIGNSTASMPWAPNVVKRKIEQPDEDEKTEYHFEGGALAFFQLWIAYPSEEGHDIARFLIGGRPGAIGVGSTAVGQGWRHGD